MKINIGDRVRFLNDVGEGTVTKVIKNIVHVLIEDGFELPVHENELVVIKPMEKKETRQKAEKAAAEQTKITEQQNKVLVYDEIEGNDNPNIYFAFVSENPDDVLNSEICLYLINDCNYILMYTISSYSEELNKYFLHGTVEPNTKILLKTIQFSELAKIEHFLFQFILYKNQVYNPVNPIEKYLYINHKKFTKDGCFETNDFFDEKAMIFTVSDEFEERVSAIDEETIAEVKKEKQLSALQQRYQGEKFKARPEPVTMEVDLHINNLLADCRGMNNHEILEYQMKQFHLKMNEAIGSNVSRIVFIHGIGNGTLKNEVRKVLSEEYSKYKQQDASFKEYGFGATMVLLR